MNCFSWAQGHRGLIRIECKFFLLCGSWNKNEDHQIIDNVNIDDENIGHGNITHRPWKYWPWKQKNIKTKTSSAYSDVSESMGLHTCKTVVAKIVKCFVWYYQPTESTRQFFFDLLIKRTWLRKPLRNIYSFRIDKRAN